MKIFMWATQSYFEDIGQFNSVVNELKDLAIRDLRLEGFSEDRIHFRLELDMRYGMQYNLTKVESPHLNVKGPKDFKDICDRFTEQYSAIYSPEATFPRGGINVECFYLTASVDMPHLEMKPAPAGQAEPDKDAILDSREAYWDSLGGFQDTEVFYYESLKPGNSITGPALIEAGDTTYVIEPEWHFTMDPYYNGVLERI
jgi:N-methylhydantoinase A/acetophenone carboxylase